MTHDEREAKIQAAIAAASLVHPVPKPMPAYQKKPKQADKGVNPGTVRGRKATGGKFAAKRR